MTSRNVLDAIYTPDHTPSLPWNTHDVACDARLVSVNLNLPRAAQSDDAALVESACRRSIFDWTMAAAVPGEAERGIVGFRLDLAKMLLPEG